jgi:hypothetical protein
MSLATTADRVPRKSLYDTSVYIHAIRSRAYYEQLLPHFARVLPTTYFCAVVAQELKAGCHTPAARERVAASCAHSSGPDASSRPRLQIGKRPEIC